MNNTSRSTRRILRETAFAAALAAAIFSPGAVRALAQTGGAAVAGAGTGAAQQPPDLIAALRGTPGVLGVDAASTMSGKQVIFAWFENKQAVLNWFYSETHQAVMRMYAPGGSSGRKPLADIADNGGPILAIASLTMTGKPQLNGVQMPVSQIAIELYAPLPGGLAAGGRFAPSSMKVPGLLEVPAN
jgi:Holliday junction resolvase